MRQTGSGKVWGLSFPAVLRSHVSCDSLLQLRALGTVDPAMNTALISCGNAKEWGIKESMALSLEPRSGF